MLPRKVTNVKNGLNSLEVSQYLNLTLIILGPTLKLEKKTPDHPRLKLSASGKGDSEMEEAVQVSVRIS